MRPKALKIKALAGMPVKMAFAQYLYESITYESYWFCSKGRAACQDVAQRNEIFVNKSSVAKRFGKKWC